MRFIVVAIDRVDKEDVGYIAADVAEGDLPLEL